MTLVLPNAVTLYKLQQRNLIILYKELLDINMKLEKPQSEAVEKILTDTYNAGRDALLQALFDFHNKHPKKGIKSFLIWYQNNSDYYDIHFKVKDE